MSSYEFDLDEIPQVCARARPEAGTDALLAGLAPSLGGLEMEAVAHRGGWYRLGGLIDAAGRRITDDLAAWAEAEGGGDPGELHEKFGALGYRVTKRVGKTHYFTAATGERPEEFVQLEVEEVHEVTDRLLFDPDSQAEELDELLDPPDYRALAPEPVSEPQFIFRRITPIAPLLRQMREKIPGGALPLARFMEEWGESSARDHRFCTHWIMMLRQETNRYGEAQRSAKPSSAFPGELPRLALDPEVRGIDLARRINAFDRAVGYPFAWYFLMLTSRAVPHETAPLILRDLMGAYDYLPARDLKILRQWSDAPYAV